jgi:hypothetical protein
VALAAFSPAYSLQRVENPTTLTRTLVMAMKQVISETLYTNLKRLECMLSFTITEGGAGEIASDTLISAEEVSEEG